MINYTIRTAGVYKITNIVNGKIYIGSTECFGDRWYQHFEYPHLSGCRKLKNAVLKYGKDNFIVEILEELLPQKDLLTEREQFYLDILTPFGNIGYNIRVTAASNLGIKHSDETKQAWSDAKRGAGNPMYGRTQSPETKAKISKALTGMTRTEEQKRRCGQHLAIPVIAFHRDGSVYKQFKSMADAIADVQGDYTALWKCLTKQKNFNTHKGYRWEYQSSVDESDIPNVL